MYINVLEVECRLNRGHELENRFDFRLTEGYSGSDITALAKDAALGPIRGECLFLNQNSLWCKKRRTFSFKTLFPIVDLTPEQVQVMDPSQVRPIQLTDFLDSLKRVRCSVPRDAIQKYEDWNKKYGDVTT